MHQCTLVRGVAQHKFGVGPAHLMLHASLPPRSRLDSDRVFDARDDAHRAVSAMTTVTLMSVADHSPDPRITSTWLWPPPISRSLFI